MTDFHIMGTLVFNRLRPFYDTESTKVTFTKSCGEIQKLKKPAQIVFQKCRSHMALYHEKMVKVCFI